MNFQDFIASVRECQGSISIKDGTATFENGVSYNLNGPDDQSPPPSICKYPIETIARRNNWSDEDLRHAIETKENDYGQEHRTQTENGRAICCPVFPEECSYVRVVHESGYELAYWTSDEWKDDPEVVMGSLLGAAQGRPAHNIPSKPTVVVLPSGEARESDLLFIAPSGAARSLIEHCIHQAIDSANDDKGERSDEVIQSLEQNGFTFIGNPGAPQVIISRPWDAPSKTPLVKPKKSSPCM